MSKTKNIFVLVGPPGAGKTTWAMKQKMPLVNIDVERKTILGKWAMNPSLELKQKAFSSAVKRVKNYLKQNDFIILDGTNLKHDRLNILKHLKARGCNFTAVVFTTSLQECLKRNKKRSGRIDESIIVDRFRKLQEEPVTMDKGFNCIIYI